MLRAPEFSLLVVCLHLLASAVAGQDSDVVTCGGFVEASNDLTHALKGSDALRVDYSRVHMHLYTSEGLLKYSTECAPNGYYFLPVYDTGEFYLEVEGPEGWAFNPRTVPFKVTNSDQGCSDDINFRFLGFALTGRVEGAATEFCSAKETSGPEGVSVELLQDADAPPLQTVKTNMDGSFIFSQVFPGSYVVRTGKSTQTIEVGLSNAELPQPFRVGGYSVSGQVLSGDRGVPSVGVYLFTKGTHASIACGDSNHMEGASPVDSSGLWEGAKSRLQCRVITDSEGNFVFPNVPCAEVALVPFYSSSVTSFNVEPKQRLLSVPHGDVQLDVPFQVKGFSVRGIVLDGEGEGVRGVKVVIDEEQEATTDSKGQYRFEGVTSGSHSVVASKKHLLFDGTTAVLTVEQPVFPSITVTKYHLCGRTDGHTNVPANSRKVVLTASNGKHKGEKQSTTTDGDGSFCFFVVPGKYSVLPEILPPEERQGLLLAPRKRVVEVGAAPVLDCNFAAARVSVSGSVQCIQMPCPTTIKIELSRGDDSPAQQTTLSEQSTFKFQHVVPGLYHVRVLRDSWCWKETAQELRVEYDDVEGVRFVQSGFHLHAQLSHPTNVTFSPVNTQPQQEELSFSLNRGSNRFCLAHAGRYVLRPHSCYKFEEDSYTYDTEKPHVLDLRAVEFRVVGYVVTQPPETSEDEVPTDLPAEVSIDVLLSSGDEDDDGVAGPRVLTATRVDGGSEKPSDIAEALLSHSVVYSYSLWVPRGFQVTIQASPLLRQRADGSSVPWLLMHPRSVQLTVSGEGCPPHPTTIYARPGIYVTGSVTPAVQDVAVTITSDAGFASTVSTDESGHYRAGPLYEGHAYHAHAEAQDFHLVREEHDVFSFRALRLGSVVCTVSVEDGKPVSGVLLSLSGGEGYRHNNATGANGQFAFKGLFPGDYFVRPLLKEYRFEPKSMSVSVNEANAQHISFQATRVAFSVFGRITTLTGEPEVGVTVVATSLPAPVSPSKDRERRTAVRTEETVTDHQGLYKLRGLFPALTYKITVRSGRPSSHDSKLTVMERTSPSVVRLGMEAQDVHGVNFVSFHQPEKYSLAGVVDASTPALLDGAVVELYEEGSTGNLLQSVALSASLPYFEFPQLPKGSYMVRVRVGLLVQQSRTMTVETQDTAVNLEADTFIKPRAHSIPTTHGDQAPINSGSVSSLLFLIALVVVIMYRDAVIAAVSGLTTPPAVRQDSPNRRQRNKRKQPRGFKA